MKKKRKGNSRLLWYSLTLCFLWSLWFLADAHAVGVNVVGVPRDGTPNQTITSYRWTLEEDATHHVDPGNPATNWATKFDKSYMPVVAQGDDTVALPALDPVKYYFISVLPKDPGTYSIGGASFKGDDASVTVYLNKLPFPTAQIVIFVFEDNFPINNAPDLPAEEAGLAGFEILLEDAGGRYGISAGQQTQDAFGSPLGTTYQTDAAGNPSLNPDGTPVVLQMGDGIIKTDVNGYANIKYLAPGKYGVSVTPPPGTNWVQTSTIEGTKIIDAWVQANEPPYFQEFGPPGPHVFIGFVKPFTDATVLTGGSTISGQIVNQHLSRPPDFAFYNGAPFGHTTPWVGLNLGPQGKGIFAQRCNSDGTFSIPNVPEGTYQLVVWDDNLDLIFSFLGVTVPAEGGPVDLGDVPVFQWFTRTEHYVFNDLDGNGFRDPGEPGIPEQNINIRWRDGSIYQAFPTDGEGYVPFDEVFPFFSWLVAEVDFARFKATGVTVTVDAGGPIPNITDPANPDDPGYWTFEGQLNPQDQDGTWGDPVLPYRTETGPVLLEAFLGFLGQTSVFQWGKKAYDPGENGGISGVVYYSTTRAENDPELGAPEVWEPGIPGVTVNLYDSTGTFLASTTTDSWDANLPTGCPGDPLDFFYDANGDGIGGDCYDGMRNWNQVRPGVFDGGYAFTGLVPGEYVLEVVPPPGYEVVDSLDKNVDFGDDYIPKPNLVPAPCVGTPYTIPIDAELSLFPGVPAPLAGQTLNSCDRKLVTLNDGANAAADFFLFTNVPIAGHIIGFILDDTANEFDPTSPQFGEKYAPPWVPISIRDWTGREIARTYSDQWGKYNALVPSTYTANLPQPSGMSPNMITVCLNSPVMPDPADPTKFIADPFFNRQYSQFCYYFQYMPGTTTYLDTPVIPVAAMAGPDQFPLDCEFTDGTPMIYSVSNLLLQGPYVSGTGQQIDIASMGTAVQVPNPAYDGPGGVNPKTIPRDYGFGTYGPDFSEVTIGGVPLTINSWSADAIRVTIPAGVTTGQLMVTRGDNNKSTIMGVTVTVGGGAPRVVGQGASIQAAIDAAQPGDLILVPPGTYDELVIMSKPVKLQGWGAGSTVINALKAPATKLENWRNKVISLISTGAVDLLPAQEIAFVGPLVEPVILFGEEGAGILVLARDRNANQGGFGLRNGLPNARIDGFTITGADHAGGIVVNGYAHYLEIGNNRIITNMGFYGGGIRIGHPVLTAETNQGIVYQSGYNDHIKIHNNQVTQNSGLGGAGGGISLCTGSDSYAVTGNFICGNFTVGEGGGIGHTGKSPNGLISENTIIFNESFNQGVSVSGGGIFIGGGAPLNGPGSLSEGSGSVKVISNLIQGNLAGAGDGGGIRTSRVNGEDVASSRNQPNNWHTVDVFNNLIVDNIAGLAGGGLSLYDTAKINIIHNTVANNDSTATAGDAFAPGSPNQSTPQPAGIVSRAHSNELYNAIGNSNQAQPYKIRFSKPRLEDDIIWHNRSFYFLVDTTVDPPAYSLMPRTEGEYWDLEVLGVTGTLTTQSSILSGGADPTFVAEYFNGDRGQTIAQPEITTALQAPPAFDEGGNFIKVRFGPLTLIKTTGPEAGQLYGDYHIQTGSPAENAGTNLVGTFPDLARDYDGEPRPFDATIVDMGADEVQVP